MAATRHIHETHKDLTPEERQVIRQAVEDFAGSLDPIHSGIITLLEVDADEGDLDLTNPRAVTNAVRTVFETYQRDFDLAIGGMHEDGAYAGREAAVRTYSLGVSFDITRPEVVAALRQNGRQAAEIVRSRMTGDLADALVHGYDEGLPIPDIADTLRDDVFPDMRGYEATRVARTEVISGSNKGAFSAYQDSSARKKEWLTAGDRRVRPTHAAAGGQIVPMNKPFVVGGYEAQHPGAMNLPVHERADCRCTLVPTDFG